MAVIMAFNEHQDAPELGANADILVNTVAGRFRAGIARSGFRIVGTSTTVFNITPESGLSEGWFGFVVSFPTLITSAQIANSEVFSIRLNSGVTLASLRWGAITSSAHTYLWRNHVNTEDFVFANAITNDFGTRKYDVWFRIHATTGFLRIYQDGVLIYSYSGNTVISGGTQVNGFQVRRNTTTTTASLQAVYSELLFSDETTVRSKVISRPFTAFGDVNTWAGALADINALDSVDTTFMSDSTAGDITTFASAAIPAVVAGESISAVILNFRANFEPTSPVTRIDPLARISGVNYFGTQRTLLNTVAPYSQRWALNPATGAAWTEAAVNALQLGFRSAA